MEEQFSAIHLFSIKNDRFYSFGIDNIFFWIPQEFLNFFLITTTINIILSSQFRLYRFKPSVKIIQKDFYPFRFLVFYKMFHFNYGTVTVSMSWPIHFNVLINFQLFTGCRFKLFLFEMDHRVYFQMFVFLIQFNFNLSLLSVPYMKHKRFAGTKRSPVWMK